MFGPPDEFPDTTVPSKENFPGRPVRLSRTISVSEEEGAVFRAAGRFRKDGRDGHGICS